MPCYHPMIAYRSRSGKSESGAWPVTFKPSEGFTDMPVELPCGQCIGCRLERSRQWAIRCMHEAQMHEENSFITLTFAPEFEKESLCKRDFQLFMKRLRKAHADITIRYFHCGEYGSLKQRAHHHACLFGYSFPDRALWSIKKGVKLYVSKELQRLWPFGFSTVGDVTFESAAYVARYVLKKLTGDRASEYGDRLPEYTTQSRRPGIGSTWLDKYASDVYPSDQIALKARKLVCRPPKYYDDIYHQTDPVRMEAVKAKRKREQHKHGKQPTERLVAAEIIKTRQLESCRREIET